MTIADLLLQDYDTEISNTRRTLERVPEDRPEWAPHEKSMKLGKLAMHCATLPVFGQYILEDDSMDVADPNPKRKHPDLTFTTRAAALSRLEKAASACRAALAASTDDHLSAPWTLSYGEHVLFTGARSQAWRIMCFNHLIHHAAQLGVYLRLLDIPVPALYGPSADEK
jgi:uncharacterized damage-inducible protein DinB